MPKKDEQVVQPDAVPEGTPSPEGEGALPEGEEKPQEQPFTEAQQAKLQEMITQAKTEAEQAGFIKGGRDMQGKKDREVAEAQRRARFAEGTLAGYDTGLGQLDPEQAELIRLRAESTAHRQREMGEAQRQQMDVFDKSFTSNMTQFITSAGLEPNDKRIDWAEDVSGDYLAKQQRILASVANAQKEDASAADEKRNQDIKDVEARLRKDLGIDSVDTSTSEGATISKKFAQVEQDYADGKISTAEYEKAMEKRK